MRGQVKLNCRQKGKPEPKITPPNKKNRQWAPPFPCCPDSTVLICVSTELLFCVFTPPTPSILHPSPPSFDLYLLPPPHLLLLVPLLCVSLLCCLLFSVLGSVAGGSNGGATWGDYREAPIKRWDDPGGWDHQAQPQVQGRGLPCRLYRFLGCHACQFQLRV